MKLPASNYQELKTAIAGIEQSTIREHVVSVLDSGKYKDLQKRIRWDLFWAVRGSQFIPSELLDDHIDTALRAVMRDTGLEGYVNGVAIAYRAQKQG